MDGVRYIEDVTYRAWLDAANECIAFGAKLLSGELPETEENAKRYWELAAKVDAALEKIDAH